MLGRFGGNRDHGDCDFLPGGNPAKILHVEDRHARARPLTDFRRKRIEQSGDLKAFLSKPWIVGQRKTEIAGAKNCDFQIPIEAENLAQVLLQVGHVVANTADAKLAEIREVFPDLRGVEMELMGERLGRNGLDSGRIQRIETTQIDRQSVGRELRDLFAELLALDRQFHKDFIAVPVGTGTIDPVGTHRKMSHVRLRIAVCIAMASLLVPIAARLHAQPAARRGATSAALIAFAGFYQSQLVVLRGTLVTRDQPVLISQTIDRAIPLLFAGPSPIDGPIELRATFWDVGRLQRGDPRVATLGLDRLLPRGLEGDWPRPGEVVALVVTDAMSLRPAEGEPTLRQIALDPSGYVGKRVKIAGQFRGRNLYGDLPQGPGLSQWDFVLRAADSAVWVTGLRPRGKGFNLNTGARVDTGNWLEATGIVREAKGLVWIEAQQLALTKPDLEIRNAEAPPIPQMGPPPEVIFSDPTDGELDVPLKAAIRLQFSRDMNPDSFKGNVRWSYTAATAANVGPTASRESARDAQFKYDRARRALEIRLDLDESAPFRSVVVELLDGIAATDGAKLKPWSLTFALGGQ
jgi:hypothetical protein